MKYTIDRTKWLRGEGDEKSLLLRMQDGKMCCLGQVSLQCGVSENEILGKSVLSHLQRIERYPEWLRTAFGDRGRAMNLNDSTATSDADKESALTALFAKHGDELEFVN